MILSTIQTVDEIRYSHDNDAACDNAFCRERPWDMDEQTHRCDEKGAYGTRRPRGIVEPKFGSYIIIQSGDQRQEGS